MPSCPQWRIICIRRRGNRLILIGGSSVAFGVDTALLESLLREHGLDYTVCPFGYYAAIGTSAMLSLAQGELRAGDVVVLARRAGQRSLVRLFRCNGVPEGCRGARRPFAHGSMAASVRTSSATRFLSCRRKLTLSAPGICRVPRACMRAPRLMRAATWSMRVRATQWRWAMTPLRRLTCAT